MPDLFETKNITPMLLSVGSPFDSSEHIFELKLDGFRCVAYCDGEKVTLKSRNGLDFSRRFPSLMQIGGLVEGRCILDGEIVAFFDGVPDRSALSSGKSTPVFAAFDILFADCPVMDKPLMARKQLLAQRVTPSNNLVLCSYIEKCGIDFFRSVQQRGLEGIVAKRKQGLYYAGKRTREWLKIKVATTKLL